MPQVQCYPDPQPWVIEQALRDTLGNLTVDSDRYTADNGSLTADVSAFAPLVWHAARFLVGFNDGDPVPFAADFSGRGNHGAAVGTAPVYRTEMLYDLPAFRFDDASWSLANVFSTLTQAEVFVVVKVDEDPPTNGVQSGIWWLGNYALGSHFPYSDGVVYEVFGASVRKTIGNLTPSLAAWRVYNVSAASEWTARLDGAVIYAESGNTVFFNSTPRLGSGGIGTPEYRLKGFIAEFLVFPHVLDTATRTKVNNRLKELYGLTF